MKDYSALIEQVYLSASLMDWHLSEHDIHTGELKGGCPCGPRGMPAIEGGIEYDATAVRLKMIDTIIGDGIKLIQAFRRGLL